jgi:hypothetical protein
MIPSLPDPGSAPPRGSRGSPGPDGANESRSPESFSDGAGRHGNGAIFGGESPVSAGAGAGLLFGVETAGGRGFTATASPALGIPETMSAIR